MKIFDAQQRGLTRVERAARKRRRRARTHLEKRRAVETRKHDARPHPHDPPARRGRARRLRLAGARIAAVLSGVAVLAGLVVGASWRSQAPLEHLAVLGLEHLAAAEVITTAGLVRGTPVAELDVAGIEKRLLEHAWVDEAHVLALPNGSLVLAVVEREPAAVLAGPKPRAIDARGVPFADVGAEELAELPRIAMTEEPPLDVASPELAEAVALARQLPEVGLPLPVEVGVAAPDDPEGFWIRLPGLPPRVVLGRDRLPAKLADLARLHAAARPEISNAERVDLRFRDQAVLDLLPPPQGAEQAASMPGGVAASNKRPAG